MTVLSVASFGLKPGQLEAFRKDMRKSKELLERCGAKNVRVLGAVMGGDALNALTISWEADDYASYGKVVDKFQADPEGAAQIMSASTPDSPVTSFTGTLWQEVNL
jgi:hypothetical protein